MGKYRKWKRWRAVIQKHVSHNPLLFCILLIITALYAISITNGRFTRLPLYEERFHGDGILSQERFEKLFHNVYKANANKECEIFSLYNNTEWIRLHGIDPPDCQRIQPLPGSCDLADRLFFSKPAADCSHQEAFNFCTLKRSKRGKYEVHCNETQTKSCLSPLSVGTVDEHTGTVTWEEFETPAQTARKLTASVQTSDLTTTRKNYGFYFIRCLKNSAADDFLNLDNYKYISDENTYLEQLLITPPILNKLPSKKSSPPTFDININLVLIDSVSHQHLFRSLPESVSALKKISSSLGSDTSVLNFQLVQAVRSRTYETLQTIFSGDVNPSEKPFSTHEMPPRPLNMSALFEKYKKRGYSTLLIEDLCYLWEWGISKDLHFLNKSSSSEETWARMWKRLKENKIDSIDVTLAMCKILEANNVADHFHGPDSVCFNGRHQHEYLLQYLQLYQQAMESSNRHYFTFTMTNVAHEDSGRRVQTLDTALAKYLKFSATLQNTLTIIFSDHGNAYGSYIHETEEARIELFHPFMIMIISKNLAKILGTQIMKSLSVNTFRLVSFLDLHNTLNYIIDPHWLIKPSPMQFKVLRKGLFEHIPVNRTCDDIPRVMPNLCICQNYDTPVSNSSSVGLFAYFAVGQLNREIQRQLFLSAKRNMMRSKNLAVERRCEMLHLASVMNVRKSFGKGGSETLKMDLLVQQSQVFFVALSMKHSHPSPGHHMVELDMYDRISPYSMFSQCADDIDLTLCVCDISEKHSSNTAPPFSIPQEKDLAHMELLPQFEAHVQKINSVDDCIYLVTIKHASGAVIFSENTCRGKTFILTAVLDAEDTIVFSSVSGHPIVLPGGIVPLAFLYSETGSGWTCSLKVSCRVVNGFEEQDTG